MIRRSLVLSMLVAFGPVGAYADSELRITDGNGVTRAIAQIENQAALAIYVTDNAGEPVANANVNLINTDTSVSSNSITQARGVAIFTDVSTGKYTVRLDGAEGTIKSVSVLDNDSARASYRPIGEAALAGSAASAAGAGGATSAAAAAGTASAAAAGTAGAVATSAVAATTTSLAIGGAVAAVGVASSVAVTEAVDDTPMSPES